jgi:hypothetical protein
MYLRHVDILKKGKRHTYWALVRSVRQGTKVRQELVCYLGELDAQGRLKARAWARRITGREHPGQLDFLEPPPEETLQVKLKGVRLERCRKFGDVWLAWVLWCALQFDELFGRLLPAGREDVPWSAVLATLVFARLCEPSSELHIAEQWFRKTALPDLLNIPEEKLNYDRLYRGLELLLSFKPEVEKHVKQRLGELFAVSYDILLYDMTSTYFEGAVAGNELAQYGYSRDKRSDCKQINIALVTTKDGLPLAYEVFSGNTADVTTMQRIVTQIEAKFGKADRIWIVDRGMVSAAVLGWLRREAHPYIVGTPKCELKKFEAQLLDGRDWVEIRDGLEVKQCPAPDGTETFIRLIRKERTSPSAGQKNSDEFSEAWAAQERGCGECRRRTQNDEHSSAGVLSQHPGYPSAGRSPALPASVSPDVAPDTPGPALVQQLRPLLVVAFLSSACLVNSHCEVRKIRMNRECGTPTRLAVLKMRL